MEQKYYTEFLIFNETFQLTGSGNQKFEIGDIPLGTTLCVLSYENITELKKVILNRYPVNYSICLTLIQPIGPLTKKD
jgi:hypothetical protein